MGGCFNVGCRHFNVVCRHLLFFVRSPVRAASSFSGGPTSEAEEHYSEFIVYLLFVLNYVIKEHFSAFRTKERSVHRARPAPEAERIHLLC